MPSAVYKWKLQPRGEPPLFVLKGQREGLAAELVSEEFVQELALMSE